MKLESGTVVALVLCPIEVSDGTIPYRPKTEMMSGLFELQEYQSIEPSMHCYEAGWWIYPKSNGPDPERLALLDQWEHENGDPISFWVTADELFRQTDPVGYGRMLQQERMMDLWEEDEMAGIAERNS